MFKKLWKKLFGPKDPPSPAAPPAPVADQTKPLPYFGAFWVGANIDLLGLHETDPSLVARYEPEWRLVGLSHYRGLAGSDRAWCSIRAIADRRKVGVNVKGLTAAAKSHSTWGKKCPFWFGATLDIQHASGGRHVCDFLYWIDEARGECATLDGNKGNRFAVNKTILRKGYDQVVAGPRWPSEWPNGQLVSMAEVLKAYPYLKVTGARTSTR